MISRTLAMACGVSTSGAFLTVSSCCGAVVVAMFFSVSENSLVLRRYFTGFARGCTVSNRISLDAIPWRRSHPAHPSNHDSHSKIPFESGKSQVYFIKMSCDYCHQKFVSQGLYWFPKGPLLTKPCLHTELPVSG